MTNNLHISTIARQLVLKTWQVENTLALFDSGATIPFISRYRKEKTGSLDETQIAGIRELYLKLIENDKRREYIISSIEEQGLLTVELRNMLESAASLSVLEDLYLPFKPKRKTRASVAREKGLEGLAIVIMHQKEKDLHMVTGNYLSDQVIIIDDALQGARDIIAEKVNENQDARKAIRHLYETSALISSKIIKGKEETGIKYQDYFSYSELLFKCPSHRLLAIFRGDEEGILRVNIEPDRDKAITILDKLFITGAGKCADEYKIAIRDAYNRLLKPSIETEFRSLSKEKADKRAIQIFAENLKQLLMSPPLGQKRILAIDPGFRTGCKVVCLDEQGDLLHNETIFPHLPQQQTSLAIKKIGTLVNSYKIDAIAIGNGTAGRETEQFVKKIRFDRNLRIFVVNEAGASVYSASKTARDEFPDYDVTVRGAISIGRRLMDPLAELVKIEPKSIGVGQYQHDVDQTLLKESLDRVVESCVNSVGVDLNAASVHLLNYVSGLGSKLARNIIEYRKKNGTFRSREELKNVPLMGNKAYEQSAGFLRIRGGINPLDDSAVHPESYYIVEKMALDAGRSVTDLLADEKLRKSIVIEQYTDAKTGIPTLKDIMGELAKPGRDPRQVIKVLEFDPNIRAVDDLKPGLILLGIVTNITSFGVFVDIGVRQDGMVHISQLANRYVANPADVVSLHQHVQVKVLDVDVKRKRIQLTMKDL
jgi:uncharacterized protein